MPRRKTPVTPANKLAITDKAEVADDDDAAAISTAIQACNATCTLPQATQDRLALDLRHSGEFVRFGVRRLLAGKRFKPDAIALDAFVRAASDAWEAVGLKPTVRDDASGKSEFLRFVEDLAGRFGVLSNRNSLYHNAVRARDLKVRRPGR